MTQPKYRMPDTESVWEWNTGEPMNREVVIVTGTVWTGAGDDGSVRISGPAGVRWVSLTEFGATAVAPRLRRR